jgi:hypothetical protein
VAKIKIEKEKTVYGFVSYGEVDQQLRWVAANNLAVVVDVLCGVAPEFEAAFEFTQIWWRPGDSVPTQLPVDNANHITAYQNLIAQDVDEMLPCHANGYIFNLNNEHNFEIVVQGATEKYYIPERYYRLFEKNIELGNFELYFANNVFYVHKNGVGIIGLFMAVRASQLLFDFDKKEEA